MATSITPGATFAHYRVESVVGRGGMGVVYRATDLRLERPVALKLIAPELAEDERFRTRFLRESRTAASLDHPGVVPIYEAGDHQGQLFIAMRYVEGRDLKTLLREQGKLDPERTLGVLGQVADALDAAHEKGLVHRDVNPANILLDGHDHAYLTDFGLTKQLGGASTETGQLVGTFAYLAPEQIRGESVDRRTDCYSLACVLYECLSGAAPFRRPTEAETLWAHMQEEPPPLHGYPELDAVLQRGLAKERDHRYSACGELLEAAASALGIEPPVRRARRLRIGRRLVLAGAALVVIAGVAAAIVAMARDSDTALVAVGPAVAAVEPGAKDVASYTEAPSAPNNIAVGEGAVWMIDAETRAITKLDPETKKIVKTFRTDAIPTDLAVGGGAVWVGNGAGEGETYTVSVSRLDPETGETTRTTTLSEAGGGYGGVPTEGTPGMAFVAGSLWVRNPGGTVSRLNGKTGSLVATVTGSRAWLPTAAGREGVWFLREDPSVVRIDPRTNRVAETIRIPSGALDAIAVGAGSVWASASRQGVVWRVEPGPQPIANAIEVGVGATYLAFGEGALWVANYVDGTVSRVDPESNRVTARIPLAGAPQALAVGAGSAWVSVEGAPRDGSLLSSSCGAIESGGRKPDVLMASDLVLQGSLGAGPRAMTDAIRFVLRRNGYRAGRYAVGYQSCDNSSTQAGRYELRRCAANATAYAEARDLVAVIGPYNSSCAQVEIPILNRARRGPLALIGPTTTHTGLTRRTPGTARGEPEIYYPTRKRNFFTLAGNEVFQASGTAMLAKELGLRRVFVLHDNPGDRYGVSLATAFRKAANRLGLGVVGVANWQKSGASGRLVARVAATRPDGVFVAGFPWTGGNDVAAALRNRLGPRVKMFLPDAFAMVPELLETLGPAAHGIYIPYPGVQPNRATLGPAGLRFAREFGAAPPVGTPFSGVLEAAQAADLVLRAIAASDGTRASVLAALRRLRVKDGILGSFGFNANGEMTPAPMTILRITGSTPPNLGIDQAFQGAVVDRVIRVPERLVR